MSYRNHSYFKGMPALLNLLSGSTASKPPVQKSCPCGGRGPDLHSVNCITRLSELADLCIGLTDVDALKPYWYMGWNCEELPYTGITSKEGAAYGMGRDCRKEQVELGQVLDTIPPSTLIPAHA